MYVTMCKSYFARRYEEMYSIELLGKIRKLEIVINRNEQKCFTRINIDV